MNYLGNECNMWLVMLNYYDLGCMQVGVNYSGDCFHTCALINWSVLLQLASELDSTLNMSYVYLRQMVLFAKKISFDNL